MTRKPNGYWTKETIISELELVIGELDHFPSQTELKEINGGGLLAAMFKNGGFNYFREGLGCEILKQSKGYWTEKIIISELELVIGELGHFPSRDELNNMCKGGLMGAIYTNSGLNYFREKLGCNIVKQSKGYWTEETTISELNVVIRELDHFPTHSELNELSKSSLGFAIEKYGGYNHFKEKEGYELYRKPPDFWTEETVMAELESVINELDHFPSHGELIKIGRHDLLNTIFRHGGSNYFREKLGYNVIKQSKGYWTEERILSELDIVIRELGHFPSQTELIKMGKSNIIHGMQKHGGSNYFMEKCGINPSAQQRYLSKLAIYTNNRGYKTEQFVKNILTDWAELNDMPLPVYNVKLVKGNVLEFVCDLDKKIGIDVTNTKASKSTTYEQIRRKWRHKNYCLYLDEFWIVVFTDILTPADYEKLNVESPENVKVFSIEEFLTELDYSVANVRKIDQLNICTFHNKEEVINLYKINDQECLSQSIQYS